MSLAGGPSLAMSTAQLQAEAKKLLDAGIHAICFSAYDEGQAPGDQLTEAQIRRKLEILKRSLSTSASTSYKKRRSIKQAHP